MILTQKEAKLWGEILTGFSQGKEYVYPRAYNKDFEVVEWTDLTDFVINEDTPTIRLTGSSAVSFLNPELIKEKGK